MPTLFIDTVSKRYERNRWALREISLRVEAGVLGLVGPNGAGKTTLLKMLATLLLPTEGHILWNGQDSARHPETVRRVLGYVPQDFGVYPRVSARVFLRYIGELKGLRGAHLRRRVEAVLEMVGLSADAAEALWTLTIPQGEFENVRARYRVSSVIPRGSNVEMRVLAAHPPHSQETMEQAEGAAAFASPKQV